MADRGWQIDLLVLNLDKADYLDYLSDKVKLINLDVKRARYSFLHLLKYIYKKRPNKILVFNYELVVVLVLLKILFRLKIKIIARNINTFSKISLTQNKKDLITKYFIQALINHFYFKADHIINQCIDMQKDLINLNPNLIKKTSVIYNPVSKHIEEYALKNDLNNIKKKEYLLCVGRLEKQKSFHYAIQGFADISSSFPDLRLKIVGQGSLETVLKQKAIELGVADRVDFEGYQKNIIPYYLYARGTILTSIFEGYPNVLIESIVLGTPVIAFNCASGPREIIENEINGYLVDPLNVDSLIGKLYVLLSKKFDRKKLTETVKQNQSENVSKLYENLIKYDI